MNLSNVNFSVLYVDPSSASPGDGSSPGNALKELPEYSSSIADNTCFLIRRTSSELTLPKGENSSLTAVAFIGMPKPADEFYSLVPEEARTSWGNDTSAEYANVKSVTSSEPYGGENLALALPSCRAFFLHRINLCRENQGAYEACIQLESSDSTASVSVERCRFGLKGATLENAAYTDTPSYGAAMYLSLGKVQVFSFRHNVINYIASTGYYYDSSAWCVTLQNAVFLDFYDVDIWATTTQSGGYGGSDPILKLGYFTGDDRYAQFANNANIDKVTCRYLQNGSAGYLPSLFNLYAKEFTSLRNITVTMENRQLGSGMPTMIAPSGCLVTCDYASEYIVENITVNLPQVWHVLSSCNIFKLTGRSASDYPGCAKIIENIHITLGRENGIDTEYGGNYYSEYKGDDPSWWQSYAALVLNISPNGSHEPVIAKNISVLHPRGVALYVSHCYLKDTVLEGMLRAFCATCDIESLSTWYPGYAIGASTGCTVRVGTLTLGKGNIPGSDGDPAILGSPQEQSSFIYTGTSNGALMSDVRSTSANYDNCYAVICGNEEDAGHYTMRTINAVCNTWGVVRSGSAMTASLKLYNNSASGKGFLSLGRQPFGGFTLKNVQAGRGTLKIRIANKGMPPEELSRRLVVQVTLPQADGTKETLFSSTCGRWIEDDSVWIGESNLAPYTLEMPLSLNTAGDVDIKIHFDWYSPSGYLYIDPDFSIEQENYD